MQLERHAKVSFEGDKEPLGTVGDHDDHGFNLVMPGRGEFLVSVDQISSASSDRITLRTATASDALLFAASRPKGRAGTSPSG